MKITAFIVIFVLNYLFGFDIGDHYTNQIDSLGLKQGLWREFEAHPATEGFTIHDNEDGTSTHEDNFSDHRFNIYKYCGSYKDGFRTGVWNIYSASNRLVYAVNYNKGIIEGSFVVYYKEGETLKCNILQETKTKVEIYSKAGVLKEVQYFSTQELLGYIFK
jgi:hypothetical protein